MNNTAILFNDNWEFAKSDLETADCQSLGFQAVDIPHDWLIYNSLNLYEDSIGWYRRKLNWTVTEGQQVLLAFDGVYMDSALYVNGTFCGEWKYGYSSFEHEITGALKDGENEILMKVVHQSPNSRWYSGAGIYRNIRLKTRRTCYIPTDGVYCITRKNRNSWELEIETELVVDTPVVLRQILRKGEITITEGSEPVSPSGEETKSKIILSVKDPDLWSIDNPSVYTLETRLESAADGQIETDQSTGVVIESVFQNTGFREIEFDPDNGLFLNGENIKLNGVCEHHDLGALGAAFNINAARKRLEILKEMGVNAVRTAHNMPARELMYLFDEMGFLVVNEAFDMWERPKNNYDYARFFPEWFGKDVRSWIRRDRNHPSLLMWSIGNEIYDTHAGERGRELTIILRDEVLKHDPKMNGKVTIGSNYMPWEGAQKCAEEVLYAGYNYAERLYKEHHREHPEWIIYGSETSSVVQSRGVYHFPFSQSLLAHDDEQCSALGNSSTSWGAKSAEACIIAERDTPFSLGQFLWTGFDYIGEPTPYHTKNSYFGQIDTAMFPKDSFYMYKAAWTDYRKNPMVHIFPYWDFNPGQIIDVRVCSNAPQIELFLDEESQGRFDIDHTQGEQLAGLWHIPYRPGVLKALAYDEHGTVIAESVRSPFGDAVKLTVEADRTELTGDGRDLLFLSIGAVDRQGTPVENANPRVQVTVSGAGRLLGLDNGDSTDYDQYKGLSRRLFNGKLLAVIGAGLSSGIIEIEITSTGLEGWKGKIPVKAADPSAIEGICAIQKNTEYQCSCGNADEVPVRKIEIIAPEERTLNGETAEMDLQVKLYPPDTSYREVEWSIVNDAGIELPIASIESRDLNAKLTANGDGRFHIRCMSRNGTTGIRIISTLEITAEGLGLAYKNPYGYISAGLYDYTAGTVSNGNEKGVASSDDGTSRVGFRDIDFGSYGSDTVTIDFFTMSGEEFPFEIWEGIPGEEGCIKLMDAVYQRDMIWNVYQPETYTLPKRLKGLTSLSIVPKRKMHIRGFIFETQNRAFAKNDAADYDSLYGDTYTVNGTRVEGIGNNVSLVFNDLDFPETGISQLNLCGKAPIDNTIHISFSDGTNESRQLIEFPACGEYTEMTFPLEKIAGNRTVTFIFLPGSNFDFSWFQFLRSE